jgi:hypothetical protein
MFSSLCPAFVFVRYSAVRKINDLVKRARHVKVHALIVGHLKSKMPSFMGKEAAKAKLLKSMGEVFRSVMREHGLAAGDFPDLQKFTLYVADMDWNKFPKLDLRAIESMDKVLSTDVPALMAQFPAERQDESDSRRAHQATAGGGPVHASAAAGPSTGGGGGGGGGGGSDGSAALSGLAAAGNPFASSGGAAGDTTPWLVTQSDQTKYRNIFETCGPVDGLVSGAAAKDVLMKSQLDYETLGKVWNLSDIDQDGYLDEDEFAVAMHLCHQVMEGVEVKDTLDAALVPPSKRGLQAPF